jgi:DNA-binding GntR family transcriptional regulator
LVSKAAPPQKSIRAESLSKKIADALREDILYGRRRQGEPVTQQAIADEFGVSTMPVREALLALSHEGMITARTNHTFRVARMTRSDVADIYWAHGVLAGALAERACERATPELIATLEVIHARLVVALDEGDLDAVESLNWDFHREVNRAADSPKIVAVLRTVVAQIPKHMYATLPHVADSSMRDHPQLIEAFKNKQCQEAGRLWTEHLEVAATQMLDHLTANGYWEGVTD